MKPVSGTPVGAASFGSATPPVKLDPLSSEPQATAVSRDNKLIATPCLAPTSRGSHILWKKARAQGLDTHSATIFPLGSRTLTNQVSMQTRCDGSALFGGILQTPMLSGVLFHSEDPQVSHPRGPKASNTTGPFLPARAAQSR